MENLDKTLYAMEKALNKNGSIEELIAHNIFMIYPNLETDITYAKSVMDMSDLGKLNNDLLYKLQIQRVMHKYKLTNIKMVDLLYKYI